MPLSQLGAGIVAPLMPRKHYAQRMLRSWRSKSDATSRERGEMMRR